jgi:tRNA (guanine37-N1)-methyltransferase
MPPQSTPAVSILEMMDSNKAKEPLLNPPVPPSPDFVYPVTSFPPPSAFDVSFQVPALIISAKQTNEVRKRLKSIMMQRPRLKVVTEVSEDTPPERLPQDDETDDVLTAKQCRKLVLDPQMIQIGEDHQSSQNFLLQPLLASQQATLCQHTISLGYDDWTVDEVLRRLLPCDVEIPSAFEVVGTLAHMNLREEQLPYKYMIGKALLDKHPPSLKTIVNKLGSIETQFRTFGMEVIAGYQGEGWSEVQVKEEGCLYHMDFQKVYWNSRLGGEHRRLVHEIRQECAKQKRTVVVADLMAGIGPFAVPLTSTKLKANQNLHKDVDIHPPIVVQANDLNPASYKYLLQNHKTNKCGRALLMHSMDARAFCHQLQEKRIQVDHVIMNLPAAALEFLDAFRGYRITSASKAVERHDPKDMPIIHVYCFAPKNRQEAQEQIYNRAEKALGGSLEHTKVSIHEVRDVSPNKNMYCVTFQLPAFVKTLPRVEIATVQGEQDGATEPQQKRPKVNN